MRKNHKNAASWYCPKLIFGSATVCGASVAALRLVADTAALQPGQNSPALLACLAAMTADRYKWVVAKPRFIELPDAEPIPILYEDRSVLAIDKPRGWMLVPVSWQKTSHNVQAAINSSIAAGDFWARSRNLKYLRYVHRLDADTSGVMLFAKSPGALEAYSALFESRRMAKAYLAVIHGVPKQSEWLCKLSLAPNPKRIGRMKGDPHGKEAETHFRVLHTLRRSQTAVTTLVEARPLTGRTHQIRVHLTESGFPIVGDELYGRANDRMNLALRSVALAYVDPFTRRRVPIQAPTEDFCREYGFSDFLTTEKGSA